MHNMFYIDKVLHNGQLVPQLDSVWKERILCKPVEVVGNTYLWKLPLVCRFVRIKLML